MKNLYLFDGTFELYRAFYSPRPKVMTSRQQDFKATVGVVQSLLAFVKGSQTPVEDLAIAFDNPIRSFRNDLFAGYKSDDGVPLELRSQFDEVERALKGLGFCVWSMRDFEADDAIATACHHFREKFDRVWIMSPDKDFGQCLLGEKIVQFDRIREKEINAASFQKSRGIAPESLPDFLALVGDSADGIPGLDGFGEKGAAAVLSAFPHLDEIPDELDQWPELRGKKKLHQCWMDNKDDAFLFRTLATLRSDAPISGSVSELHLRLKVAPDFASFCADHGLQKLLDATQKKLA